MNEPGMIAVYLLIGFVVLMSSRQTIRNARGFTAFFECMLMLFLWPVVLVARALIFAVEGNLWENLE